MTPIPAQTLINVADGLRDDEIHVWHVDYRTGLGRSPLYAVLAAYLGVPSNQVVLLEGEHGRPELGARHDPSWGFNWSHSGPDALIAIGRDITPGIDIEYVRARPRALEVARRYFSPDEAAALEALADDERHAAFLEIWTAKEAVLKALGRGIAFGLHRLSIGATENALLLHHLDGEDSGAWQLQRLVPGPSLIAALAWRGEPRQIKLQKLAFDD